MFCRIRRDIVVTHSLSLGLELVTQILHACDIGRDKHQAVSMAPILEDQWNPTAVYNSEHKLDIQMCDIRGNLA